MKKCKYLDEDISILELSDEVFKRLKDMSISSIDSLWNLSRTDLKNHGFTDKEIKHISIKMQLLGIDLNKKIYWIYCILSYFFLLY